MEIVHYHCIITLRSNIQNAQNNKENSYSRYPKSKFGFLTCAAWNINRGLIKRETEIKIMLKQEDISILFLTETDSTNLENSDSYIIPGFQTVLPLKKEGNNMTRIICLVRNDVWSYSRIRQDLMTNGFPSIWMEITQKNGSTVLVSGFL